MENSKTIEKLLISNGISKKKIASLIEYHKSLYTGKNMNNYMNHLYIKISRLLELNKEKTIEILNKNKREISDVKMYQLSDEHTKKYMDFHIKFNKSVDFKTVKFKSPYFCKRCNQYMNYGSSQIRKGDEADTVAVRCLKCGKTFRLN